MSIMVATGRGAEAGVLVRDAAALEALAGRHAGRGQDRHAHRGSAGAHHGAAARPGDGGDLLRLAASVERSSEHPLAGAIVRGARDRGVTLAAVTAFSSVTGKGVTGVVEGARVEVGTAAFLAELGVDVAPLASRQSDQDPEATVLVALDGTAAGVIGVADRVKDSAIDAIRALTADGHRGRNAHRRSAGHRRTRRACGGNRQRGGRGPAARQGGGRDAGCAPPAGAWPWPATA